MIEGAENGDERIDRLVAELTAYGVIDARHEREGRNGREGKEGVGEKEDGADLEHGGPGMASRSPDPPDGTSEWAPVESVFDGPESEISFEEAIVKQNLEAVLLGLISVRGGAHGKALMGDLSQFFDAQLSPGTVYPRLHDLEADGVLRSHELVRTKEYTIADETRSRERIERAMGQHVALGAVFRSVLGHTELGRSDRG